MKIIRKIVVVLVIFSLLTSTAPMQAQAAKKITDGNAKAYAKMINHLYKKSGSRWTASVIVHDMNNDGVPELLYNDQPYGSCPHQNDVYTYKKGKVIKIGSCPDGIYKVPNSKTKYRYSTFTGVGCYEFGQITFSKKKIDVKTYGEYFGNPTKYYIKDKQVNEKKYLKEQKKYKKHMTNSTVLKSTYFEGEKWTAFKVKSIVQ